jgi:hypothetical protein
LQSKAVKVSLRTVGRVARAARLRPYKPRPRPVLTEAHRRARLAWAKSRLRYTRMDWAQHVFSDEKYFVVSDRNVLQWLRPEEARPILERGTTGARMLPAHRCTRTPSTPSHHLLNLVANALSVVMLGSDLHCGSCVPYGLF